jgi:adenosyl cobinamide kinase/adenosyl cobinamide phosphate guanylyltransferase
VRDEWRHVFSEARTSSPASWLYEIHMTFSDRLNETGKPAKVVIVDCMRKMSTLKNAMLKNDYAWIAAET